MPLTTLLLAASMLAWGALRLQRRLAAWLFVAPVFLALGLTPASGASEDPTLTFEAGASAGEYRSICGPMNHFAAAGGRVSYERALSEQIGLQLTGGAEVAEHEVTPDDGNPHTVTEGFSVTRVGVVHRWASASVGVGLMWLPEGASGLAGNPSAAVHLGPRDIAYLQAEYMDDYADAAQGTGRIGLVGVLPVPGLQRAQLGAGVSGYGPYLEALVRSQSGFGLQVQGARAFDTDELWQVNAALSWRVPVKDL